MRFSEILTENAGTYTPDIDSVLLFLRARAPKESKATLKTNVFINYMKNAGDPNFTVEKLIAAFENDPTVKNMLDSVDEKVITFKTSTDDESPDKAELDNKKKDQQAIVSKMAKKAAKPS